MQNDYGNNRSLDEMVMVDEERKRAEEARRKKAEAERKRKQREEAKRKKTEAEKARKERERQRKERDERHKARNERREQSAKHRNIAESTNFDTENSFSPKPTSSGIIKPKFSSITQIQDAQKAQKKLIDDLRKKQWGDLSTGTDEIQIINTQNVDKAKQGLADLDREETAAYGLGDGGYWENSSKTYGQGMQHAFGNIGDGIQLEQARKKAGYDAGMQNAYGNIGDGIKAEQERKAIEANQAYYKSFTEDAIGGKPEGKEKPITPTQSYIDDLLNAGGKGMPGDGEEGDEQNLSDENHSEPLMPISAYQWLDNDLSSNPEYFTLIKGYYDFVKNEGGKEAVLEYLYGYEEIPDWYTDVNFAQDFARFELTGKITPIENELNEQEDFIWDELDDEYVSIYPDDNTADADHAEQREQLEINGDNILDRWLETPLEPEQKVNIIEETLVNMPPELSEYYYNAIQNGQCQMQISEYNEMELTEAEAVALYFKEQEERNQAVAFIVAAIETAVTMNPTPLIMEIGDIAISQLEDDDVNKYISDACLQYIEAGGDISEFTKNGAVDLSIETILNTIDSMRDDITQIEGGTYATIEIQLIPFNDATQVPNDISGLPENYINVDETWVSLRYFVGDEGLVCNWGNPICYQNNNG